MRSHLLTFSLGAALSLGSGGCIGKVLVDGQIHSTRLAASSFDTTGDYEMARGATPATLGQFEGLHSLSPDNPDALYLLARTYTAYGNAFIEDEMQAAEIAGNDDLADFNRKRARIAYDRAIFYAVQILGQQADGFEAAKKDADTMKKWVTKNFTTKEDALYLYWAGLPWLARAHLMQGDDVEGPPLVAELYVGVAMVERAAQLDPTLEHYFVLALLGSYHARSAMAEPEEARKLFETALAQTQGKNLLIPLQYATTYACAKGDAALYQNLLHRVVDAQNPDPEESLPNTVAKHFARRWLGKKWAKDQCGIELAGK